MSLHGGNLNVIPGFGDINLHTLIIQWLCKYHNNNNNKTILP